MGSLDYGAPFLDLGIDEADEQRTVTDARVPDRQLDLVEALGHAWVDGELDPAICGIAAPLRDRAGRVIAAISINTISGMTSEAQARKKFLIPLKPTAQDIRTQMVAVRQPAF